MLCLGYETENEYVGKSKEELLAIGEQIRQHGVHKFDEAEVQALVEYAKRVLEVPAHRLAIDGVVWLLPPIVILVAVFALLAWTK